MDFVLTRKEFADEAEEIIGLKITHKKKLYTSILSMANVAYVVRKAAQNPYEVLEELLRWIDPVNLTTDEFEMAMKSKFKDFEDSLQYYCALSVKADVIISRDSKGFLHSALPVMSPGQFLKNLDKN